MLYLPSEELFYVDIALVMLPHLVELLPFFSFLFFCTHTIIFHFSFLVLWATKILQVVHICVPYVTYEIMRNSLGILSWRTCIVYDIYFFQSQTDLKCRQRKSRVTQSENQGLTSSLKDTLIKMI